MTSRRAFLQISAATIATTALPSLAHAQDWPKAKPIRAVVPFAPGSSLDIVGRLVMDPLSRQLGQTIVIDGGATIS